MGYRDLDADRGSDRRQKDAEHSKKTGSSMYRATLHTNDEHAKGDKIDIGRYRLLLVNVDPLRIAHGVRDSHYRQSDSSLSSGKGRNDFV